MVNNRILLAAGVAVPVLYYGTLIGASLLYPGYSHTTQYASELGMAGQPSASLFNGGVLLTSIAMVAGSFGIRGALRRERARPRWATLGTLGLALFGVGLFMGGLFPMPDPRHGGFGLGMGIHLAPLLIAVALWPLRGRRGLSWFLIATTVAMAALLAVMMGVGGFVTRANVGLLQRAYTLAVFPWVGIVSWALRAGSSRQDSL